MVNSTDILIHVINILAAAAVCAFAVLLFIVLLKVSKLLTLKIREREQMK